MLCEEADCQVSDCWKDCPRVRYLGDTPVVAGEIGKGGYIVFGDDAIFQNEFLERYNGPFAKNMVKWLLASIKTQL